MNNLALWAVYNISDGALFLSLLTCALASLLCDYGIYSGSKFAMTA
jgi:hypothetical protein